MSPIRLVFNNIPKITKEMEHAISVVVKTTGYQVEQIAKTSMSGPKHGRLYRRGNKTHIASAPGEPPAVDTGKLKSSIVTKMVTPYKAEISANTEYARILEVKRNRKFFEPAVNKVRDDFVRDMEQALGRVQ